MRLLYMISKTITYLLSSLRIPRLGWR